MAYIAYILAKWVINFKRNDERILAIHYSDLFYIYFIDTKNMSNILFCILFSMPFYRFWFEILLGVDRLPIIFGVYVSLLVNWCHYNLRYAPLQRIYGDFGFCCGIHWSNAR